MNEEVPKLTYLIAEKKFVLVISFVGPLVRSNLSVFEECMREVEKRGASFIILNFRDVPSSVDRTVFPAVARLQKLIRLKPAALRMTALHPELRKVLDEQGLLRAAEVANNLGEALQSAVVQQSSSEVA